MTAPRLDIEDVRAALRTEAVLDAYGWRYRRSGRDFTSTACPARADHSRRALVISARDGRWQCFPCGTKGDLFDFIAGVERLSIGRDFGVVLAKAAAIAGVGPSTLTDDERAAKRAAYAAKRAADEARELAERREMERAAIPKATGYWAACAAEHEAGAAYLAARGLIAAERLCRFDLRCGGSPALPLHTSRGEIRNVVRRLMPDVLAAMPLEDQDRKTPGLYQCPSPGTLLGTVGGIVAGRPAIVTEGFADTLTAAIAWPGAVVLGAHGAGNLPAVAQAAARRCAAVGARLAIVPHNDAVGVRAVAEAVELALEAGLRTTAGTLAVIRHVEKDLNDAWCAGWRPAA